MIIEGNEHKELLLLWQPVKTGGRWYQKNAKPAQETKADPKKKKGKKQPEQHKGDHQPDTT